jgi:ABC-type nitrate/sulfonate/bicarbonate transport system substrate-binding protein
VIRVARHLPFVTACSTPRALGALLVVCALVWLLGGCAGPAPSTAQQATSEPSRPVSIGYAAPSASFLPVYVAQEGGLFRRNGLEVSLQQIQNNAGMAALIAGELDVYDVASGSLVPAALGGADLVLLVSDSNRTIFGLIAAPDIASTADLKGRAVGITVHGASDDFLTQRLLRVRNLEPNRDVVLQPVGGIPEKLAAMEVGHIAGGMMSPPTLFIALEKGYRLIERPAELFEYQGSGLVMRRSKLASAEGDQVARRLVKSHVEAIHAIRTDRELALRALNTYAPSSSAAIAEQTLDWAMVGMPKDGFPTLEGLRSVIEDSLAARGATAALQPQDLVELKYLQELERSGLLSQLAGN